MNRPDRDQAEGEGNVKRSFALFGMLTMRGVASASSGRAGDEQCRAINAVKERMECFDKLEQQDQNSKQSKIRPKSKNAKAPVTDQLLQLKNENERLSKRINTICRGC